MWFFWLYQKGFYSPTEHLRDFCVWHLIEIVTDKCKSSIHWRDNDQRAILKWVPSKYVWQVLLKSDIRSEVLFVWICIPPLYFGCLASPTSTLESEVIWLAAFNAYNTMRTWEGQTHEGCQSSGDNYAHLLPEMMELYVSVLFKVLVRGVGKNKGEQLKLNFNSASF